MCGLKSSAIHVKVIKTGIFEFSLTSSIARLRVTYIFGGAPPFNTMTTAMSVNKTLPCTDIQEAFLKHGFPLNMYLYKKNKKNSNNNNNAHQSQIIEQNDVEDDYKTELHCVQSSQEVPVYRAIDVNGKERNIHCNSFSHAYYTVLKPDLTFSNLAEIHQHFCATKKKKSTEKCSKWVVCIRNEQTPDGGILLRRGQVFKLISYKDCRGSSRCSTNTTSHRLRRKRAKIQFYGSRESFWIPHDLHGQFRLCETDPGVGKRDDMASIVQKYDFPILIREDEKATSAHWCLLGVTTERYIISCTDMRQIVVFPARNVLLRDVLQSLPLVSSLSQQELQSVETKVFSNKYFEEEEHYTGTFKDFGIFRKPELGLPSVPEKPLPPVPVPDYPDVVDTVKTKPTPLPKPTKQSPRSRSRGGEGGKRGTRRNTRPTVPKRDPRYSLKLAAALKASGSSYLKIKNKSNNNDAGDDDDDEENDEVLKKYLCTPMLNDPDDTDPDESDDGDSCYDEDEVDDVQHGVGYDRDNDDDDDDDYINRPRIIINEKIKEVYTSHRQQR